MACRELDFLWKEYFRDPSQFWDQRNSKRGPSSPDFTHKQTREPLWIDGLHNPSWVMEELRKNRATHGDFYVQKVRGEHASHTVHHGFPRVHHEFPNRTALMNLIKACGKQKDLHMASRLHADILDRGLLKTDISLGNALLNMYAKCGALEKAQDMFNQLPTWNIVKWNALIGGYVQHGLGNEALSCYGRMQDEGLSPDAVTFICILKACRIIRAVEKGEEIHAEIRRHGLLQKDIVLGTALVDMYAKCGVLAKAQEVFNELPAWDVAVWNALISGYAQYGLVDEALSCLEQMQDQGLSPNAVTYTCILKACSSIGAAKKGEEIHAEVSRQGLLGKDLMLGTALVDMYGKCGALAKAREVFDKFPAQNVVRWNALIAGYVQHGFGSEALSSFQQMRDEGITMDTVTFICVLKACGSIGAVEKGEEIHAEVDRQGLLKKDIMIGTALVDMYAKCGVLAKAQQVFDELPARNEATWNALITGYAQLGLSDEALSCFGQMRDEHISPNAITFIGILQACGSIGAVEKAEEIHAEVHRQGLLEKDVLLGNALVDVYAKCGTLLKAQEVFDELPARDVSSWNALITGYAQHGLGDEALIYFGRMQDEGISPDAVTLTCILKACGIIGAVELGVDIHAEVHRQGLLEKGIVPGTALVDMYVKCGMLASAQQVFDELPAHDVATWTALISGYAQAGEVKTVFDTFIRMIGEGVQPNAVTFAVLLTACSHAGLMEEGQRYFDIMSTVYGIIPTLEHCTCMVDIFSRAGYFDKAISMIEKVPSSDRLLLWSALMGACRKWANVELGRLAFEHAVQLDGKFAGAYVCMSNIYADAGMQEEAAKIEALRMKSGAWKAPGRCWWTDISRRVHSFTVEDKSHPQIKCIHAKLKDIVQKFTSEGYDASLHWVSRAIPDDGEEDEICAHTQELAIACALIHTPENTPIHITKNMRFCGDCHFTTSLISKVEKRKILVKDAIGLHIFENGVCVCEGSFRR